MDLTAAIACAALLMGQPYPAHIEVNAKIGRIQPEWCVSAGRPSGCSGAEFGHEDSNVMIVILSPDAALDEEGRVHAGCHVVQVGSRLPWHGPVAERQCERIQQRAKECNFTRTVGGRDWEDVRLID